MIGWEGCSPGVVFPKRLNGGVQPTSQNLHHIGAFHSLSAPTPPPPHGRQPMTQDLSEYFFKEKQDFEPLWCKLPGQTSKALTTKTRVSELVPLSPDSENLWNVPFTTKICIFCYHIYDLTKNLIAYLWLLQLTHPKHKLWTEGFYWQSYRKWWKSSFL